MRLTHLSLGGLRVFAEAELFPGPGVSWLYGVNGAGKTSVLEALYTLGHGRSFRSAGIDSVLRDRAESLWISSRWAGAFGERQFGAGRARGGTWDLRADGTRVTRFADLGAEMPMLCFEPGSHALVSGPSERRRRLLDWGVFHVERAPLSVWQDWQRALLQRNQALRNRDGEALDAWDMVAASAGERLNAARELFASRWLPRVCDVLAVLSAELGTLRLDYRRGWGRTHPSLGSAWSAARDTDLAQGFTGSGPQRMDISLRFDGAEARDRLSRGQSKLVAMAMLLALAQEHFEVRGRWPLLLLDDLGSELDAARFRFVLEFLRAHEVQALITGVDSPAAGPSPQEPVFHVERGTITPLL
jgi:DNA replication and repair protein RecF